MRFAAAISAALLVLAALLALDGPGQSSAGAPAPGPDGLIAFASGRDGNSEIYLMNPDGTEQARVTNNAAEDTFPALSPDATKIVFQSNRDGNGELYVVNTDGSGTMRVTNEPTF